MFPHEPLLTGWLRAYFTLCAREVHHKIFLFALDSRFNIKYILLVNVFKQQIDTAKSAAGRERRMGKVDDGPPTGRGCIRIRLMRRR